MTDNPGNTYDPTPAADNHRRMPLFIMSMVYAPVKSQLSELDVGGVKHSPVKTFPPAGNWPFMEIADPILRDIPTSSCDLFKSSDWTPPGCNGLRGYIN